MIAAVAKNGVIGRSTGEMPWHSKEEFQHFKSTTLGSPVIMGRKTFESLGGALKKRLNIVLTTHNGYDPGNEDVVVLRSLPQAYQYCREKDYEKIFVIGGGEIFREGIKDADGMILSIMDFEAEGDVYFPDIKEDEWIVRNSEKRNEFEIKYYERSIK